jgi:predicted nucleic acid-binding protein
MAMTVADPVFIDTNVLVFARFATTPLHRAAVAKLDDLSKAGSRLWLSRQILREYMVAVTRPQTFFAPLPLPLVHVDITRFEAGLSVFDDNAAVTAGLLDLLSQIPCGGKQIHDANVVATMLVAGIPNLLTDNIADFKRFSHLIKVIPLVPPGPSQSPPISPSP